MWSLPRPYYWIITQNNTMIQVNTADDDDDDIYINDDDIYIY